MSWLKFQKKDIFCSGAAFLFFSVSVLFSFSGQEGDKSLLLRIGDKRFKDKTIEIFPNEIYSALEGRAIPFSKMIREMNESRFIYVGESHNSLPMHDLQLRIIQSLHEQDRALVLGLEMMPVFLQEVLNKWSLGILSQQEFIREAKWYVHWNYNFGFYEKIFEFAKENKIPVYALNVPREIITKIRMKGWEALSDEEKKLVPQPDLSNQEHRLLIRTIFETTEIPPQMKGPGLDIVFEGLYRSQSAWDEVMASNLAKFAEREEKKMIVLAGSGHLLYNLGLNRRLYERSHLPSKTVICVAVPQGKKSIQAARSLGDYIWGIPEEERPVFPSLGLSFKKFDGLENLVIESKPLEGVSEGQDFEKGDIVLSVDEKSFTDINELRIYLARFKWDEEVKFRLLRNGQEKEVTMKFRFSPQSSSNKKN